MSVLPVFAALFASTGWAAGIVMAHRPAQALGAFEFTRVQLIACAAVLTLLCAIMGYWQTVAWQFWPSYLASICFGIILGNLAMIECLRRGGPRRTELMLSFKGPVVAVIAYLWLGETISVWDVIGALIVLGGVVLAVQFGSNKRADSDRLAGSLGAIALLGFAAAAFQGFGFLVMKPAMQAGTEPLVVSAIRLAGAAFIVSVVALWPLKAFRPKEKMTPKLLRETVLPGVIGYGVSSSLLLYSFANFHTGVAAVLGSLSPVIVLPILWVKDGQAPRVPAVLGAALAITGTAVIVLL